MLSRRTFLVSASAAAVGAALPPAMIQPAAAAAVSAPSPLLAFAVGTPGEYDWHSIFARSAEDAFKAWAWDRGVCEEGEDPPFDPEYVQRVPIWDDLPESEITPALWFAADMGHMCERCNYETHPDMGGRVVSDEVVCEECLEFGDYLLVDREQALDGLIDYILNEGEDGAKTLLIDRGFWPKVPTELWAEAIAEAAKP